MLYFMWFSYFYISGEEKLMARKILLILILREMLLNYVKTVEGNIFGTGVDYCVP